MTKKKIACLHLELPSGDILSRQLIELSPQGEVLRYYPLDCEVAFTEWHSCTYKIAENGNLIKKSR